MNNNYVINDKFDPRMLHWYEGMVLMPQHFQQNEMIFREMQLYYLRAFTKFSWGVVKLDIDKNALHTNILKINSIECVLENGEIIFFSKNSTDQFIDLSINLKPYIDQMTQHPMKVYLCIPELVQHRYIASKMQVTEDFFTEELDNKAYIAKLTPNVSLVVSHNTPSKYISIPICEVNSLGSSVQLTNYIPPMVFLPKESSIIQSISSICSKVRRKISYIKNKTNALENENHTKSFDIIKCSLTANFLKLEQSILHEKIIPEDLFLNLINFAGSIYSIGSENFPVFETYDHLNIKKSFDEISIYINNILDTIDESYDEIYMQKEDGIFQMKINNSNYKNKDFIYFEIFPNASSSKIDMIKWVKSCIIVSEKFVKEVCDSRILGSERNILSDITELNITHGENSVIISVPTKNKYIEMNQNLLIFNISETLPCPSHIVNYRPFKNEK
ncbi:type VI secretion system baseplate subunit TssK [Candidatus Gromoviella agglomerans]|uniref:type VI secretion system baseplate subunit TssK n=1 Tax=Candidatus Gromoviella agglomerans TaxID=2806609 RepID=UPI001E2E2941|nr:type VI secretion system baseplate subunit TssK [Candidatus Gromoviella agglomerans]